MKNPLLIVGLMVAVGAGVIGAVIMLGKTSQVNPLAAARGVNLPAEIPGPATPPALPKDRPVPSETGPWPVLKCDKTTFGFGRMAVNSKKEHTFVIRNEGEADLIMKEGQPTCKCTTFALDSKVLKPGEETRLVINWKAGVAPDREFSHGGDVYTNDPKNSEINFGVHGAIETPIEVLPNIWSVGAINLDAKGFFQASIGSSLTDHLELEPVENPNGKVKVTLTPMNEKELSKGTWLAGFQVNAEVAADIPTGKFEEEVTFNVIGIDDVPKINVTVTARKYGSFILQPLDGAMFVPDKKVLQLGAFPASEGRTAKLLVIVDEKGMTEPFQIAQVEADPPFLTAKLEPLGVPTGTIHRYTLEISVPSGRPRTHKTDAQRGQITIHTNHPSKDTIFTEVVMHSH